MPPFEKEAKRTVHRNRRNKELDGLVNIGILSKVEFSEWAAPTVYIWKKYALKSIKIKRPFGNVE